MKTVLFLAVSVLSTLSFAGAFNPPDCGAPQRLEEIKVTSLTGFGMSTVLYSINDNSRLFVALGHKDEAELFRPNI